MKENYVTKISRIKEYLLNGNHMTTWDAIEKFHHSRLSAVIHDLRNIHGLVIDSYDIQSAHMYGIISDKEFSQLDGTSLAVYHMSQEAIDAYKMSHPVNVV